MIGHWKALKKTHLPTYSFPIIKLSDQTLCFDWTLIWASIPARMSIWEWQKWCQLIWREGSFSICFPLASTISRYFFPLSRLIHFLLWEFIHFKFSIFRIVWPALFTIFLGTEVGVEFRKGRRQAARQTPHHHPPPSTTIRHHPPPSPPQITHSPSFKFNLSPWPWSYELRCDRGEREREKEGEGWHLSTNDHDDDFEEDGSDPIADDDAEVAGSCCSCCSSPSSIVEMCR